MDKWIIFDFDGTLANTLPAWVDTWNWLAEKYGYKKIGLEDYVRLKAKSSLTIKAELGVPWWRVWLLERAGRNKFSEQMQTQKLYSGIAETVLELKQRGFHLAILTSNAEETVRTCLKNNGCGGVFDFIYAGNALFKKGKKLKKLLISHRINSSQAIYVGDETRDIDAARQAGVKAVSVTWGLNTKGVLQSQNPDSLIDKPEQLVTIV